MSSGNQRQPVGSLKISCEVIGTIASVAALEIEGVEAMAQQTPGVGGMFRRKFGRKPVEITVCDDFVEIDMQVVLRFGAKITEVCAAIQSAVKDSVQTMTGMAVSKVNVVIADIAFTGNSVAEQNN